MKYNTGPQLSDPSWGIKADIPISKKEWILTKE